MLELKDSFMDEEVFAFFEHSWSEYKMIAGVTKNVKQELAQYLDRDVQMLMWGSTRP